MPDSSEPARQEGLEGHQGLERRRLGRHAGRLPRWGRRGRPEHGLRRARRAGPDRGRRSVVPARGDARDRPRPPGLRVRPRPVRRPRGRRAHARSPGPHRRVALPAPRDRGPPRARLRDPVHPRAGRGPARGAPGPRPGRVPAGDARRGRHGRPVLDAVHPRDALDPRRHGGRDRHAGRLDPAHRRLQDRPDPARRPADRPARARGGGGPRRPPAPVGLHERRGDRLHLQRTKRRAGPAGHHLPRAADRGRRVLQQPHPPDPAGRERRARGRARRGVPGSLDAPERRCGPRARDPPRPRAGRRPDRGRRARSTPRASS